MNAFVEMIASNSIVVALLAVVVALFTRFLRQPSVAYGLWLLVLLKLVTPPLMSIPLPVWPGAPAAVYSAHSPTRSLAHFPTRPRAHAPTRPPATTRLAELPADRTHTVPAKPALRSESPRTRTPPTAEPPFGRCLPVQSILISLWLTGSVGWLLLAAYRMIHFSRWLRRAESAPPRLQQTARDLARRFRINRIPHILLTGAHVPPLLWAGRTRLMVVLPTPLLDTLEPSQQAALLAHELAHYRRRDHWTRWLETAVLALYWWHPVAWFARRRLQQAEEQCCDAWVLWAFPDGARRYALALLQTVEFLASRRATVPFGASAFGQVRRLESRLRAIVESRPARSLSWPRRGVLIALACCVLPLGAGLAEVASPVARPVSDSTGVDRTGTARNSDVLAPEDDERSTMATPPRDTLSPPPLQTPPSTVGEEPDESPRADAIRRAVEYLNKQQRADGSWNEVELYPGGITALCTLALLEAGVAPDDEHVQKALSYLRTLAPEKTYAVAVQTMAYCAAGSDEDLVRIRRNVRWLESAQIKKAGPLVGAWAYDERGFGNGDSSNSHFAILALASAAERGVAVDEQTWKRADSYWRTGQRDDGSWGYRGTAGSGSMTCAGITALAVIRRELNVPAEQPDEALGRAVRWLGEHFSATSNPNRFGNDWYGYYLAALGRAASLANIDRFGEHDWRAEGVEALLKLQDPIKGAWRGLAAFERQYPTLSTSFALLFLTAAKESREVTHRAR